MIKNILVFLSIILVLPVISALEISQINEGVDNVSTNRTLMNFSIPDSTIRLYSNERNIFREGQSIELYAMKDYSKAGIGFYDENNKGMGWLVCHNMSLADENNPNHQHCSIETSVEKGWMVSRQTWTWGEDWALTRFVNTNVEFTKGVKIYLGDNEVITKGKIIFVRGFVLNYTTIIFIILFIILICQNYKLKNE